LILGSIKIYYTIYIWFGGLFVSIYVMIKKQQMGRSIPYATVAPTPPTADSGKLGFGKFVVDAVLLSETKYGFEVDHTK